MLENKFNPYIKFSSELKNWKYKTEKIAKEQGLSFSPIIFEIVNADQLYQISGFGGFPTRYSHWSFGQEYENMRKQYFYKVMKISEMVINTNPVYAYLANENTLVDQKLVMAHVYGHADFFKNNLWFQYTDRNALNTLANHAKIVDKYIDQYGEQEIEEFLDICLSIDQHIDKHSLFIKRKDDFKFLNVYNDREEEKEEVKHFKISIDQPYMEEFINPSKVIKEEREKFKKKQKEQEEKDIDLPEKDLLLFLICRAPLKPWQRHILSIIREEAYYFAPQGMTKIMNEGWASYWHSEILTKHGICEDSEIIEFAECHAGTMGSSRSLNLYKLGYEIFLDIEERWNKGKFGKEYNECLNYDKRKQWDTNLNLGREKIFQVRRDYNDVMFIDEFFTKELCQKLKMFTYDKNDDNEYYISNRDYEVIKQRLLFQLTNHGKPQIIVVDADYNKDGILFLEHKTELPFILNDDTKEVLSYIQKLWKKDVCLRLQYGEEHKEFYFLNNGSQTMTATVDPFQKKTYVFK